jgi:hypothetical protein
MTVPFCDDDDDVVAVAAAADDDDVCILPGVVNCTICCPFPLN